jgi:hypothetical protein
MSWKRDCIVNMVVKLPSCGRFLNMPIQLDLLEGLLDNQEDSKLTWKFVKSNFTKETQRRGDLTHLGHCTTLDSDGKNCYTNFKNLIFYGLFFLVFCLTLISFTKIPWLLPEIFKK